MKVMRHGFYAASQLNESVPAEREVYSLTQLMEAIARGEDAMKSCMIVECLAHRDKVYRL